MKVLLSCDDGFETSIIASADSACSQLFVELCSIRKCHGLDLAELSPPTNYSVSIKSKVNGKDSLQHVSPQVKLGTLKLGSSSLYFVGFKLVNRALAINELKEFSSKLSSMSLAFSNILGSYQSVIVTSSDSVSPANGTKKTLDEVRTKISVVYHDTLKYLDDILSRTTLSDRERSIVSDVKRKL
jgi:hypothetical protein